MRTRVVAFIPVVLAGLIALSDHGAGDAAETTDGPRNVYYFEPERMAEAKRLLATQATGDDPDEIREAAEFLREEANDALRRGPYSVMDKDVTPPSGDKHDYASFSVYWWPDPTKKDGLPFIRRDGETNREWRAKGDRDRLELFTEDAETLALARYFLGRRDYGEHGARLVRTWFLDEATRMTPHLDYAQSVPGLAEGRGGGIIDARELMQTLDAIELLAASGDLTESDMTGLREWFQAYHHWLATSKHGRSEQAAKNNHGAWYAAHAARVALFVGDRDRARELVERARSVQLPAAIDAEGKQPEELARTKSLHYTLFNLSAYAHLARYGESLGVDLWNEQPAGGAGIQAALKFAAPFVLEQDKWPYEQIDDYRLAPRIIEMFRMASARYGDLEFRDVLREAPRSDRDRVFAPLTFSAR